MRRFPWLLCLSLVACGPSLEAPPEHPETALFEDAPAAPPPGIVDDAPAVFVLAPGDVVRVAAIGGDPWVLESVLVDEAGTVHVPLVGAVEVAGSTLRQAEVAATEAYRRFDRFGQLSITLVRAEGHRATVVGSVVRPGAYATPPGARLSELLALAGGPVLTVLDDGETIPTADVEGAQLVRGGEALPISVPRAVRGDPRHDVRLRPGDVLWVPSAHAQRISVMGEVNRGRTVPFRSGMKLTEALALAGGPTGDADLGDVRVLRGSLATPRVYRARLSEVIAGEAPDVALAPGDVVFVTQHWSVPTREILGQVSTALAAVAVGGSLAR